MLKPWDADEMAWAEECFLAGDSIEEIAATAGRTLRDVWRQLAGLPSLTPIQREVLSLYSAGCTFIEIDSELGRLNPNCPGKAAAQVITFLRTTKGLPIPKRNRAPEAAHA